MNSSEMYEITLTMLRTLACFDIKEEMTVFSGPRLNDTYQQAIGQGADKIMFNFNGCTYISSAGVAIFIQIIVQAKRRNQSIGITGLPKHFEKIFRMLGIAKFAKIHDSLQCAMEELNT